MGPQDFELGIQRQSSLVYHCAAPGKSPAKGLAFVIPDFGDDAEGEDFGELRRHLADAHGLLAVTVEYHCYRSRLKDGARFELDDVEFSTLRKVCERHLVPILDRNSLLQALGALPEPYEFELRVATRNGDYQNFGVMQALDHLAVLHDLRRERPGGFDSQNVVVAGRGHGGYLASLLAKVAPNAVRAVIAIDARTKTPLSYLFGEAAGGPAPYYYHAGRVRVFPLIATRWVQDASSPAHFSPSRQEMRDVALASHVGTMKLASRRGGSLYRLFTTAGCLPEVANESRAQAEALRAAGFDAESRGLEHQTGQGGGGTGAILAAIAGDCLNELGSVPPGPDTIWHSSVSYLSGDLLYSFDFDEHGLQLSIVPLSRDSKRLAFY